MHTKILIVVDDSEIARAAITEGLGVAATYGAEVVLYYVLPNYVVPMTEMPLPDDWSIEKHYKHAKRKASSQLALAALMSKRAGVKYIEAMGSDGDAAECIAKAAVSRNCDLIVIGSHGRTAFQRLILGSVVTRLITLSTVPMLVCKKPPASQPTASATVTPPRKRRVAEAAPARAALVRLRSRRKSANATARG